MTVTTRIHAILDELTRNTDRIDDAQLDAIADEIAAANHIFLAGAGRSGIAIAIARFASRLMLLCKSVSIVGETTSPHSAAGDPLIIGSGSGETASLVALARKAKATGDRGNLRTPTGHLQDHPRHRPHHR
ncbi:SIS domain-containing protein [Rhodococcus opacus]|nr:SIS domain-containing protein [Rhodococcus opacus]